MEIMGELDVAAFVYLDLEVMERLNGLKAPVSAF